MKTVGVCGLLVAVVWLVFGQTLQAGFVNFDDGVYVFQNPLITAGLTRARIAWFCTHAYCDYWAPLLALSHMADCQTYGLWAPGHHLTNVLLFAATVVLLFLVLRRLTLAFWPSAFAAAAWAVHPLRVESVAWVTERKDMLSGVFFLLTLVAYAGYVRGGRSWRRYAIVVICFGLGLMCKPMVVTLPLVLLLLDFWPFGRAAEGWKALLVQKVPLFVLSAALGVVTVLTGSQTLMSLRRAPFIGRLNNAAIAYVLYLRDTVYPAKLAVFYPYPPQAVPLWEVALALLMLGLITWFTVARRRTQPWLVVGWFWYLVMLAPIIGIVQTGEQARADRDLYLPQIGLLVAITWSVADLCRSRMQVRVALGLGAGALVALLLCARVQAGYWRNSETLWRHALACSEDNQVAHNNLGTALDEGGRWDEAKAQFQAAVAIQPNYAQAQYNLGNSYRRAGQWTAAIEHYRTALAIDPDSFDTLNSLGMALVAAGRRQEAAAAFASAITRRPGDPAVRGSLGNVLFLQGRVAEAVTAWRGALALAPGKPATLNNLAWVLATGPAELRDGTKAVELAEGAERLTNGADPVILQTLAAACAEAGRLPEARDKAAAALTLAQVQGNARLAAKIADEQRQYEAGLPYHDPPAAAGPAP